MFAKNSFHPIAIDCSWDVFFRYHQTQAWTGKIGFDCQHKKVLARNLEASTLENRLEIRSV